MPGVALLWYRRDLRLHDHPALQAALASAASVVPVYVLDPRLLDGRRASANRAWFLFGTLRELAGDLAARGAPLIVRRGDPKVVIPALAAELGARDVFATRDVSPFARARDRGVAEGLAAAGGRLHLGRGLLVAEPEEIHAADGRPVTPVSQGRRFDPDGAYVRRWVPELARVPRECVHAPWTMPRDVQQATGCLVGRDYPGPIVDHAAARERALAAYAGLRRA